MSTDILSMFMMVLKCRAATYLRDHLAATRDSVEYTSTPTPIYSRKVYKSPRPIFMRSAIPYSYSSIQ